GDHQALFGQNGDQRLLLQPAQSVPHGCAADVAHLSAEFLLVQKLAGGILAAQDPALYVVVSLQLQAGLCGRVCLFHVLLCLPYPAGLSQPPALAGPAAGASSRWPYAVLRLAGMLFHFIISQFRRNYKVSGEVSLSFHIFYKKNALLFPLFRKFCVLCSNSCAFCPACAFGAVPPRSGSVFDSPARPCYTRVYLNKGSAPLPMAR